MGHKLFMLPSMLEPLMLRDFVALHMTWGAINELTTLAGYYQLIRRSDHPQLHAMLRKVIQDERRHFAFYRAQAKARLTGNPRAGRIVRWALKGFWTPVGAGVKSDEEVDALTLYLFGDAPEGRRAIQEIDATISELPGLQGLRLLEDVLDTRSRARRPSQAGEGRCRRCAARPTRFAATSRTGARRTRGRAATRWARSAPPRRSRPPFAGPPVPPASAYDRRLE